MADAEPDLGFQLIWSDYRGHTEGRTRLLTHGRKRARPQKHVEAFATRDEALAAEKRLHATGGDGIVSSVVPVTLKAPTPSAALLPDLPLMPKRLTK